ncbi:MAG: LPS export ABC transporter periplasmic protein LptC, partial [Cyanobacteria bacterium J06623_7]
RFTSCCCLPNFGLFKLFVNRFNTLVLLLPVILIGCQASTPEVDPALQISRDETQLVLNNAVLEQSNPQSDTVWKIKADNITYSDDNQIATLDRVVGNLWQNGTIILKISAKAGTIEDNGNIILLNKSVIASDPRNGSVITSDAVEWRPQENLLLIKAQLVGSHPNLEVTARKGKYLTDVEKLELEEDVVATSDRPALQLNSERLEWNVPQGQIISPGAINLVHFDEKQIITDRLVSDRAELNLEQNQATLNDNIELISVNPPLQVATDFLTWNYQQRIGSTDRPIQILARDRQVSLTGNQGEINFPLQVAKLGGGVQGVNQPKKSGLYAQNLTWNIDTEEVEAKGNVIYEQTEPKARLMGEKARGKLGDNNIIVTSEGKQQVTSIIDN